MTSTPATPATGRVTNPANDEIVLIARIGTDRIDLTARNVIDTVACYLATRGGMPDEPANPYAAMQIIRDEWQWGDVDGWVLRTDFLALDDYRRRALAWVKGYFGTFPAVSW